MESPYSLLSTLSRAPSATLAVFAAAGCAGYIVWQVIYRLYFHPLAKFPGPRLAAITRWYDYYWDVTKAGKYTFKIAELHKQYGPVLRIAPNELHFYDSEYWDVLYPTSIKVYKDESVAHMFGNSTSMLTTADYTVHRRRRAALGPMFSRQAILSFQGVISKHVQRLSNIFTEHSTKKVPINVSNAFPALTGDIIVEYSFGFTYKHLDSPGFSGSFHKAFLAASQFTHMATHFPMFHPIMNAIPTAITKRLEPGFASLLTLQKDLRELTKLTVRGEDIAASKSSHPTIFREVLNSSLSAEDKAAGRMADEAQTIVGAGVETTAFALTVATFHIANTPHIYERLHTELASAIRSDAATIPELTELEPLPYLRACILESIRLSYGVTSRLRRVFDRPLEYGDWTIPPRTIVSASIVDVTHDETIFPDSHAFVPERWLGDPRAPSGKPLEHYLVTFSKGSRICLGINLAYAELFLTMATIFRWYKFELFETDVSDIALKHDMFLPFPKLDSKGVRVLVSKVSKS